MATSKVPEIQTPARAPERKQSVEEDEIVLGTGDPEASDAKGRSALRRPSGFTGIAI